MNKLMYNNTISMFLLLQMEPPPPILLIKNPTNKEPVLDYTEHEAKSKLLQRHIADNHDVTQI